jgi:hypothetical protein
VYDRWSCRAQQCWRFADVEMKYEGQVSGECAGISLSG